MFLLAMSFAAASLAFLQEMTASVAFLQFMTGVLEAELFLGMPGVFWISLSTAASIGAFALILSFLCRARRWSWVFSPAIALSMGVLLLVTWAWANTFRERNLYYELSCLRQGKVICASQRTLDEHALLEAVSKHVPVGAAILSTTMELAIRYVAMRPVVWSYKDGGVLAYCNHSALLEWGRRQQSVNAALASQSPEEIVKGLADVARSLGASYLIVDFALPSNVSRIVDVIWQSTRYAILRVEGNGSLYQQSLVRAAARYQSDAML